MEMLPNVIPKLQKTDATFKNSAGREAETVLVDVYSISGVGRMRAQA